MTIEQDIARLCDFDTPTICNALELIDTHRTDYGYTNANMICINPHVGPIAGIACTATMRSLRPSGKETALLKEERLGYYRYVAAAPAPKICVMQDLDGDEAGRGPFWGEFNTRIHRALGCAGIITDNTVRDIPNLPGDVFLLSRGIRASHANVHLVNFDVQVNVFGMVVTPGAIVHADVHGAVTFPASLIDEVIKNAREFVESEAPIIEACKRDSMSIDELAELYMRRR